MQTDLIKEKLLKFVLSGSLAPGSRLKEVAIAKQLGVSRTPLREALIVLEQEGFLTSRPNAGYSVKTLSVEEVLEIYPLVWTLENLAFQESFEKARTYLSELEDINKNFLKAKKSPARAREYDFKFHYELLRGCRNTTLHSLLSALKQRLLRYENRYMEESTLVQGSHAQHKQILAAIAEGDKKTAGQMLIANWKLGMDAILARIS